MKLFFTFLIFSLAFLSYGENLPIRTSYEILVLDTKIQDLHYSKATSINDKGVVCGVYEQNGMHPFMADRRAFIWDVKEGFRDIGCSSVINVMINEENTIIGVKYAEKLNKYQVFKWKKETGEVILDIQSDHDQALQDINNCGQILCLINNTLHLYENDHVTSLHCTASARLNDQKNRFEIVTWPEKNQNALLQYFDFPTHAHGEVLRFKGSGTCTGFNNKNCAIGEIITSSRKRYGFVWKKESGLKMHEDFFPCCLNDNGKIVGIDIAELPYIVDFVVMDNGNKTNLRKALNLEFDQSCPIGCLMEITAINNLGQIVGMGDNHAILIYPPLSNKNL